MTELGAAPPGRKTISVRVIAAIAVFVVVVAATMAVTGYYARRPHDDGEGETVWLGPEQSTVVRAPSSRAIPGPTPKPTPGTGREVTSPVLANVGETEAEYHRNQIRDLTQDAWRNEARHPTARNTLTPTKQEVDAMNERGVTIY